MTRELLFEKMRGTELENLERKRNYKPNRNFGTKLMLTRNGWGKLKRK
jgi:hypothetical protein